MHIKELASRSVKSLAAFGVGFALVSSVSPAWGLSRSAGVSYAQLYSCNSGYCYNPQYKHLGLTDCANFVSQSLHASGLPMRNVSNSRLDWYHYHNCTSSVCSYSFSPAWVNVTELTYYLSASGYITEILKPTMSAKFSGATAGGGDVYVYDWGRGAGYSHVAYSTGKWTFENFYDSHYGKSYSEVTGGSGDMISQHSPFREKAPWNWGYQTETDPSVRVKMRTMVLVIG